MIRTANGGRAAVGTEFDHSVSQAERRLIEDREAKAAAFTRSLPRRKTPEHEKPGAVSHINCAGLGWTRDYMQGQ